MTRGTFRGTWGLSILALVVAVSGATAQENEFVENRWVAILSAYPSFADARDDAEKIAKASGLPFSMEDRIFDKKRGLIYPDSYDDEVFAGNYVARRYNETLIGEKETPYLSIERSDGYDGFRPGYYIVIAGIYESAGEAKAQSARFKDWAPTSYAKKTKIYLGCLH
jgi:hypothetical protein